MLKSLTTRHASWSVGVFVSDSPAIEASGDPILLLDLPFPTFDWSRDGCHHSSAVQFCDRWVTAIDEQVADFYVHKITDRAGAWMLKTYAAAVSSVRSLGPRSAN